MAIDVAAFVLPAYLLVVLATFLPDSNEGRPLNEFRWICLFNLFVIGGAWLYLGTEVIFGRTLGKASLGLYVRHMRSKEDRSYLVTRWLLRSLPLGVGGLVALFDLALMAGKSWTAFQPSLFDNLAAMVLPLALLLQITASCITLGCQKQSWYDLVAGTQVLRHSAEPRVRGFEPIVRDPAPTELPEDPEQRP
jgi:uncharacterized RDD family membrane protein YckC